MAFVFLKPRDSFIAPSDVPITVGMLAEVASSDEDLERQLRGTPFLKPLHEGAGAIVVSSLDLVRAVKALDAGHDIRLSGADFTVVKPRVRQSPFWAGFWIIAVSLVLFFGAMMAIMAFHADTDMGKVHQAMYHLVTGNPVERPLVLQLPYSVGVGLGVLIFFNAFSRRKPSSDPSPLDVQMHLYDQETDAYLASQGSPTPGPQKEGRG